MDELIDGDLAAIEAELAQLTSVEAPAQPKKQLKRVGEDISEKLDYVPGEFTVERHIRGKWACEHCETLIQALVPPQVINKLAKLNEHDPYAYLKNVLARLLTQKNSAIEELLPHNWTPVIRLPATECHSCP